MREVLLERSPFCILEDGEFIKDELFRPIFHGDCPVKRRLCIGNDTPGGQLRSIWPDSSNTLKHGKIF